MQEILGTWDNFQQFWQENTEEDIHRVEIEKKHNHFHMEISPVPETNQFKISLFEGRNAAKFIGDKTITSDELAAFNLEKGVLVMSDIFGFAHHEVPYHFNRCRKFTGWIQYPLSDNEDDVHFQADLALHDQGGMVELDIEGIDFTVELTQLIYGKKLHIMKLAIYDIPLSEVGINSKSISYTWTNPEAKRLGINLRKIVSGWTLVEEGFVNRRTLHPDEK